MLKLLALLTHTLIALPLLLVTIAWGDPPPPHGAEMVAIPAGTVVWSKEKKEIAVAAFFIDRYEVTQQHYEKIMGENLSFFKGAKRPVENINWHEADAYCRKVGKRLPTEWEWEHAARAGSDTSFYWGDAPDEAGANGWHKKNSGKRSHPVGEKKPNAYGLYDMAGNVWEWTASDHENSGKVMRGGSWRNSIISMRSRHRILSNPLYRYHYVGFRCALAQRANLLTTD